MSENTPPPNDPLPKRVTVEKLGDLDSSMARLQKKMGIFDSSKIKRIQDAALDPEQAERMRERFGLGSKAARIAAGMERPQPSASELMDTLRSQMPDPALLPPHRTMKAVEQMARHMETLAETAIRADQRADESEARADRLEEAQGEDRTWNRANTIFAAVAAVASIAALVIAILLA